MRKYYSLLLVTMMIWGLNVVAVKFLVATFAPLTMQAFRIFTASVAVFLILRAMKLVRLPLRSEWGYIIGGAVLNVAAHHCFLALGLARTYASNASLILGTAPIWTMMFAAYFLREKLTLARLSGVALGFIGLIVVLFGQTWQFHGLTLGDSYILLSIVTQSASFIMIRRAAKTMDARLLTGYMMVFGSFLLMVSSFVLEPNGWHTLQQGTPQHWLVFFASAIIATAVCHMIYNYCISQIGPTIPALFINLSPFFALVGSVLLLGETLHWNHLAGFVLIVAGVIRGSMK